jgi:UbiD family decarboxylase
MQGKPYRVVKTANGLDVPYGSEYVLEGRLLARQREVEGPFGEFPGYYSGGHRYPVIEIDASRTERTRSSRRSMSVGPGPSSISCRP